MVSFRGVPAYDQGCLGSKSALKTTPPSTLGTLGRDLVPREESRQLVGSRIGGCRVVFSGGGVRCAGKGSHCYSRRVFGYVGALHGDLPGARVASNLGILYGDPFFPSTTIIMAASPRTITTRMESFRPPPPRASTEPVPHAL